MSSFFFFWEGLQAVAIFIEDCRPGASVEAHALAVAAAKLPKGHAALHCSSGSFILIPALGQQSQRRGHDRLRVPAEQPSVATEANRPSVLCGALRHGSQLPLTSNSLRAEEDESIRGILIKIP